MTDAPTATDRPLIRWSRRLIMLLLAMLTLAIMAAILLPVYRGVSDDPRPRDAMGLPLGYKPPRPARGK